MFACDEDITPPEPGLLPQSFDILYQRNAVMFIDEIVRDS
jgi:hypothetical protein